MRFCQNCGNEVSKNAVVCVHCGVALQNESNMPNPGKGFGITAMILGICSLILPYIGVLLALIGLILGVVGKAKSKKAGMPSGMATAGIVCSIIALAFTIVTVVFCWSLGSLLPYAWLDMFEELYYA
ncbi:MAG: zinc ribbon domain-containing protein [Oscillospiraceae bacterium]|nr:zinc ribbon domain-containing protein [Oscillospiraceae bacterium]